MPMLGQPSKVKRIWTSFLVAFSFSYCYAIYKKLFCLRFLTLFEIFWGLSTSPSIPQVGLCILTLNQFRCINILTCFMFLLSPTTFCCIAWHGITHVRRKSENIISCRNFAKIVGMYLLWRKGSNTLKNWKKIHEIF